MTDETNGPGRELTDAEVDAGIRAAWANWFPGVATGPYEGDPCGWERQIYRTAYAAAPPAAPPEPAADADARAILRWAESYGPSLGAITRLVATIEQQARELAELGNALGDAARELPGCSGPVAKRILVYRAEWQERAERAEAERDALESLAESLRGELRDILEWSVTENAPLREQERESIRAALAARKAAP